MKVVKWLALGIAIIALIFGVTAYKETCQLTGEVKEAKTAMYANVDEAMRSVADSFKLNRLDFNLQWKVENGFRVKVGVFR